MVKKLYKFPEVLFFQEGPGVRNHQYTTSGVKLLNVSNLRNGQIDLTTSDRYISENEAFNKYSHFLCDPNDFIIASSGIKIDSFNSKMGFIHQSDLPVCMNTSTIRFKVLNKEVLEIRYFMYYLKSVAFKKVLTSSKNIFIVKISIIILTILDLKYSDEILENIKILSLSSEFTLLGILFIKKLKNLNVNKEIFELGKKVYAWGKIACVFYLDANTNEIKDWVLEKGYEENILYNFATMTYFDKADIRGRLQKTYLSKTEFAQISFLIDTLVFSKEIIYLDDKEELLMKYLEKAKIFALSEIDYMAIDEIWVFVDSDMWYMGEKSKEEFIFSLEVANKLLKDCEEILNNRIR